MQHTTVVTIGEEAEVVEAEGDEAEVVAEEVDLEGEIAIAGESQNTTILRIIRATTPSRRASAGSVTSQVII